MSGAKNPKRSGFSGGSITISQHQSNSSELSYSGSLPRSCPSDGRGASGRIGSGWFPRSR